MDNGEVIPGLNDGWTLLGAKLSEWSTGMIFAMFFGSAVKLPPSTGMPLYMGIIVFTAISASRLRKQYPDEEKGIANAWATKLGFAPPNIPRPASLQPVWSGAPLKRVAEKKDYTYLGLDDMFEFINNPEEEDS